MIIVYLSPLQIVTNYINCTFTLFALLMIGFCWANQCFLLDLVNSLDVTKLDSCYMYYLLMLTVIDNTIEDLLCVD